MAPPKNQGKAFATGWLDWNRNGKFDDNEASNTVECAPGDNNITLNWAVPQNVTFDKGKLNESYLRLRVAEDQADAKQPRTVVGSGEVEDYKVNIAPADLKVTKEIVNPPADPAPGDTLTYRIEVTNPGRGDHTETSPATMFDDLSGVLDDADLVPNTLRILGADLTPLDQGAVTTDLASTTGRHITWTGPLAAGDKIYVEYQMKLKGGGDGKARNVAYTPYSPTDAIPQCTETHEEVPAGLDAATAGTVKKDTATGIPCDDAEVLLPKLDSITKNASTTQVRAGDTVTYTVTLTNTSTGNFTANYPAQLTDALADVINAGGVYNDDAALAITTASGEAAPGSTPAPTYDRDSHKLTWSGPLAAGNMATLTYSVTYRGEGTTLNNTACTNSQDVATPNKPCATVSVPSIAPMQWKNVEVVSGGPQVAAGTQLKYTLHFANKGTNTYQLDAVDYLKDVADDAVISDLQVGESGLNASYSDAAGDEKITVTGTVPAGTTADKPLTVTYLATIKSDADRTAAGANDQAVNFLANAGDEPPVVGQECTTDTDVTKRNCTSTPISELTVTKDVSVTGTAAAGSVLTYTLTFSNGGKAPSAVDYIDYLDRVMDDATWNDDLTVTQTAGAGNSMTTADATYSATAGKERIAVGGSVGAGETYTVTYSVTVKPDATRTGDNDLVNVILPAGEEPDPADRCTLARDNCTLTSVPKLAVTKTVNPTSGEKVDPGQELTYTLTFENSGSAPATIDYVDDLSGVSDDATLSGFATTDAALTIGEVTGGALPITGTLKPGQEVTYTLTFTGQSRADGAGAVDFDAVDHLADVLDDAEVTGAPRASSDAVSAKLTGDLLEIEGALAPGEKASVTYTVTVKAYGELGDSTLTNVVAGAGEDPSCKPGLCTTNDVPPKPEPKPGQPGEPPVSPVPPKQPDGTIPWTGAAVTNYILLAILAALGGTSLLVLTKRRRRG